MPCESVLFCSYESVLSSSFKYNKLVIYNFLGPEIRTGLLKGGGSAEVELVEGNMIKLSLDEKDFENGDASCIFVDYKNLTKVVKKGDSVRYLCMVYIYFLIYTLVDEALKTNMGK